MLGVLGIHGQVGALHVEEEFKLGVGRSLLIKKMEEQRALVFQRNSRLVALAPAQLLTVSGLLGILGQPVMLLVLEEYK